MSRSTDYHDLYMSGYLPLAEAYFMAEYMDYINGDKMSSEAVISLRGQICREAGIDADSGPDAVGKCCRDYMKKNGYYSLFDDNNYSPVPDIYGSRVRNEVDYLSLYKDGLIPLHEAYVLAKNKNLLLHDDDMLGMIFALEDELFSGMEKTGLAAPFADELTAHVSARPRKQITGGSIPLSYMFYIYMGEYGFIYDSQSGNSFRPAHRVVKQYQEDT